jgi:hypothetical protein
MTTVRKCLEEIRDGLKPSVPQTGQPGSWAYHAPSARAIEHAVAALDLMDNADELERLPPDWGRRLSIPDPDGSKNA